MEFLSVKYLIGGLEPAVRLFISILLVTRCMTVAMSLPSAVPLTFVWPFGRPILFPESIGYPIVLIHRNFFYGKSPNQQHIYFILTGVLVGIFCYGWGIIHPICTILVVYCLLYILGGTLIGAITTLVFTMTYLLVGYYMTSTSDYDIKWTMSQCVLTLRLTGVAIDLFDGQQPEESLSKENKPSALKKVPTLLEVAGHTFFPAAFVVGPQFHMKRYQDFVVGKLIPSTGSGKPNTVIPAMMRFATGILYLIMYEIGVAYIPEHYIETQEFDELGIIKKHLVLGFWGRIVLYKYITCWLVAEGVCILSGVAYSGVDSQGKEMWTSCGNIKLAVFENSSKFSHYIASFNSNTNAWIAQYVYKRLKFLNNRLISQGASLLFLAVWHGFHSGYYVCFFNEFVVMLAEREVESLLAKNEKATNFLSHPLIVPLKWVVLKLYAFVFMGFCLVPFVLLSFSKYWAAYKSIYFSGYLLFVGWHVYAPLVRRALKPPRPAVHQD